MAAPESGLQSRMDGSIRPAEHIQQAAQGASSLAEIVEEVKENNELQAHEIRLLKKHYFQECSAIEAASFQASAEALEYKAEAFEHKASCELWQARALAVQDRAWAWQTGAEALSGSLEASLEETRSSVGRGAFQRNSIGKIHE